MSQEEKTPNDGRVWFGYALDRFMRPCAFKQHDVNPTALDHRPSKDSRPCIIQIMELSGTDKTTSLTTLVERFPAVLDPRDQTPLITSTYSEALEQRTKIERLGNA